MEDLEKVIMSDELIEMLKTATEHYGNRPVFVEINGKRYTVNDISFTAHGRDYTLILN